MGLLAADLAQLGGSHSSSCDGGKLAHDLVTGMSKILGECPRWLNLCSGTSVLEDGHEADQSVSDCSQLRSIIPLNAKSMRRRRDEAVRIGGSPGPR